jgi:phage pi2 protein 07
MNLHGREDTQIRSLSRCADSFLAELLGIQTEGFVFFPQALQANFRFVAQEQKDGKIMKRGL